MIVVDGINEAEYFALGQHPRLPKPKKCPSCERENNLIRIGYYKRWVSSENREERARIGRVKCKSCKTSHALLPSFLIPRRQEVVGIIAEFLRLRVIENKTLKESMVGSGSRKTLRQKGAKWLYSLWKNRQKVHDYLAGKFSRFPTARREQTDEKLKIIYPLVYLIFQGFKDTSEALSHHNIRFYEAVKIALI